VSLGNHTTGPFKVGDTIIDHYELGLRFTNPTMHDISVAWEGRAIYLPAGKSVDVQTKPGTTDE